MKSDDFSKSRLLALLEMGNRRVYWRHDVDFSTSCAIQMAKLETAQGVRSTYFLRVDEEEYSLQGMVSLAMELDHLGHTVGVHVCTGLPRSARPSSAGLVAICTEQFRLASSLFQKMSRRVSLHMPPRSALWRNIEGFMYANAPCWKGFYLADSRGEWQTPPEAFLLLDAPVQLNLHPEWWFLPAEERAALREQEAAKP